ncbi:LacI family DNA-binding transcriptional regulator [Agromyces aerolatus]|uniref:LacI family DNA-binding transcriptional regulator n=1 Tax=Agromyces sp. LY-1074 TaxID=3074080 RepID=UPI00286011F1|nr:MULTISPECIES: LacI family DNA-binding transcriptional regulator [unclassified Agromyces]MDR5700882.1 LacI family DNA-binding transcriptional regulator [Agromyces sp. LY-1074]MDR5707457.1 LacI family DNA-binding transcriptional regulator [Agromyces sp. LY-1358]
MSYHTIAAAAGVSVSTISRYLNGHMRLRPDTEARVRAAIEETGFIPDPPAKPAPDERQTVGIVVPHLGNSYYGRLAQGLVRAAEDQNYAAVVTSTLDNPLKQLDYVYLLEAAQVKGILYAGNYRTNTALAEVIEQGIPVVVVDEEVSGLPPVDAVLVDDYAGAFQATTYLCAQGHRDIAFVGGPASLRSTQERKRAFEDALRRFDVDPGEQITLLGSFTEEFGAAAISRIFSSPTRTTAVFAASDIIALGALSAVRSLGMSVPEDLSIVGFDDIPESRHVALTTIRTPLDLMAKAAVTALAERIDGLGSQARTVHVPVTLQIRESTRPAA